MAHVLVRQLLDLFDGEPVNRLCELRGLSGRGLDARRKALARSYRGDHASLFEDLRVKDLVRLLRATWDIDGTEYQLEGVSSCSRDELIRLAKKVFCRDGIPGELVELGGEEQDEEECDDEDEQGDDDSEDNEPEDDEEYEDDEDDDPLDNRGPEHARRLITDLSYSPDARKDPHEYQRLAETAVLELLGPQQPQLLHLATGGGKTLVANNVVVRWLERRRGPVLWVTKDWRLLYQAARDLRRRHHGVPLPTRLGGDGRILHPLAVGTSTGVVYTTIQTLTRRLDDRALRTMSPSLLVWDECHWGEHSGTGRILTVCGKMGIPVLGLTATPRTDTRYNVAFSRSYRQLVDEKFLAEEIVHSVATGTRWSPELQRLGNRQVGDVTQASLRELAGSRRRNEQIVSELVRDQASYGKTIVFACTVEHATKLAEMFNRAGLAARPVHHHQDDGENERAVKMFREGQIQVLVNVAMLTHGIDVPDARTVFLCRPTTSDILFAQMIGRACRRDDPSGKTTFNVVEFTDNVQTHADVLFKTAKVFFQGAGAGRPEPGPRSLPAPAPKRREHAFDPTGAPTWMPVRDDVPESMRGLWYRERQTFGVEIELADANGGPVRLDASWHRIAEELRRRLALVVPEHVAPEVTAEHLSAGEGKDSSVWNVEFDSSAGWEVTSRILQDYPGFKEVDVVCRALDAAATELGLAVNYKTGLHIHIGWLSGGVHELKRAVRLAKLFEPALGTLVGPSRIAKFAGGRYDLSEPNVYCAPVSSLFSEAALEGLTSKADFARAAEDHGSRYVTFNIQPLQTIDTVEVRMHSGTVEARKILPWLSLWMQILWAAANRADIPGAPDRKVIEPDGDVVALALEHLPDARQPQQRTFIQRIAARRSEVVQLWAKNPHLRPWLEHTTRWVAVPGLPDEA
jgi:superfamily II DNA or RNA helicase